MQLYLNKGKQITDNQTPTWTQTNNLHPKTQPSSQENNQAAVVKMLYCIICQIKTLYLNNYCLCQIITNTYN